MLLIGIFIVPAREQEDREAVAPVVVRLLGAQLEACPPGGAAAQPGPRVAGVPAAVLAKEAAYTAAGVGAYELHDYIDFRAWYHAALLRVRARGDSGGLLFPKYILLLGTSSRAQPCSLVRRSQRAYLSRVLHQR
jgi:hypothetical protein